MGKLQGKDDVLYLSSDGGTTKKALVCETSHSFQGTRNTTRTPTKCDGGTSAVGLGSYEWNFQSSIVVETAPSAGQVSYEDLLGWFVGGTQLDLYNANPDPAGTNFYHAGKVYVTDLSKSAEVEGLVSAEVTFSGDGVLDITP